MALVKPLIPNSLHIREWFQHIFLHNPEKFNQVHSSASTSNNPYSRESLRARFRRHLEGAFLETYGFDGYDEASTEITTAQGQLKKDGTPYTYESNTLPTKLAVMSFFGIPNRVKYVEDTDKSLVIGGMQVLKNFLGGWNDKAGSEKMFWQKVGAFSIKPIIFIIKVCLIFSKTALNTLKLISEFLPTLFWRFSEEMLSIIDDHRIKESAKTRKAFTVAWILKGLFLATDFIGLVLFAASLATFRVISIFGRVMFSPEKSARIALRFGKTLHNKWLGWAVGISALVLSIVLSAILWAIALPLLFSAVTTLIPATVPLLTSFSKFPLVAASISMINGSIVTLGTAIGAAFSPLVTAVAALVGLKISATALAVGATFAVFVTPTASALSWGSDRISNVWANWVDGGPGAYLSSRAARFGGYTKVKDVVHLDGKSQSPSSQPTDTHTPSHGAQSVVKGSTKAEDTAQRASYLTGGDSTEDAFKSTKPATPVKRAERSFIEDSEDNTLVNK